MMLPFCGHFYRISLQQSNSNKFKDFEISEYYGIRIETFELPTVEKTRLGNQNSNYMKKNMSKEPKNLFNFDDFSNYVSSN